MKNHRLPNPMNLAQALDSGTPAAQGGSSAEKSHLPVPQNRRKIEKDRRKKNYHDVQVQGTNNSSIVSKRSVEMLYNTILEPHGHQWFLHFVPKAKRRSPAINRGYWVRMESIYQSVVRIQAHHGACVQAVNLGCGFDPFAFKMLATASDNYVFFDLDYPALVLKKLAMIQASPEIMAVIGEVQPISDEDRALGLVLSTDKYKLVGCDLKNVQLYQQQLERLMTRDKPSIFIAEVSLAYMKPEHANPVVALLAQLPDCHVLVLEQILPAGANHFFAQKMLYHFNHLTSPLQCVEKYCTKDKQAARFRQYLPHVEVVDLFESWNELVSDHLKGRVQAVEDFDEWEEFIIFCQHYVVIHATNSDLTLFGSRCHLNNDIHTTLAKPPKRDISMARCPSPPAKFPAACEGDLGIYSFGGMHQSRMDSMVRLPNEVITSQVTPPARMCHTLTRIGKDHLLLVGGRARPGCNLRDVWLYHEKSRLWSQQRDLESGLSRHSAVALGERSVLVFHRGIFSKFEMAETLKHKRLNCLHEPPLLISAGMVYCPARNVGYLVGGMVNDTVPDINSTLYRFQLDGDLVVISALEDCIEFCRIGCMARLSGSALYIIGGAGHRLQNQQTTVVRYDTEEKELTEMRISDDIWDKGPVFIGSCLAGDAIVGGGAVCYSFGSSYNDGYLASFE